MRGCIAFWRGRRAHQGQRIGCGLRHLDQGVAVAVEERLVAAANREHGVQNVAPAAVGVENDLDTIGIGAEGIFQKGGGADAVLGLAALSGKYKLCGVGRGVARRNGHLAARNGQRLEHQPRRRLPQPVADLVVESRILIGGENAGVIV